MSSQHAQGKSLWAFVRSVLITQASVDDDQPKRNRAEQFESIRQYMSLFQVDVDTASYRMTQEAIQRLQPFEQCKVFIRQDCFIRIIRRQCGSIRREEVIQSSRCSLDSTGLSGVWPSEHALTKVCMENAREFEGARVLELGAGQSGLAGITVAKLCNPYYVMITDGLPLAIEYLRENICRNDFQRDLVIAQQLNWNNVNEYSHLKVFDSIILADCVFIEQSQSHLLKVLSTLLAPKGTILYVGPERSKSLSRFRELIRMQGKMHWNEQPLQSYPDLMLHVEKLASHPEFNADFHVPKIINLRWKRE